MRFTMGKPSPSGHSWLAEGVIVFLLALATYLFSTGVWRKVLPAPARAGGYEQEPKWKAEAVPGYADPDPVRTCSRSEWEACFESSVRPSTDLPEAERNRIIIAEFARYMKRWDDAHRP